MALQMTERMKLLILDKAIRFFSMNLATASVTTI